MIDINRQQLIAEDKAATRVGNFIANLSKEKDSEASAVKRFILGHNATHAQIQGWKSRGIYSVYDKVRAEHAQVINIRISRKAA